MHAKIATYLAPVEVSEADRVVESAKNEISLRERQRIEEENFTNSVAVVQGAVEQVWLKRLVGRPVEYLGVMLDEFRRKHYLVGRQFAPFVADTGPNIGRIPRRDESLESRIYRATGFYVRGVQMNVQSICGAAGKVLGEMALLWSTLLGGGWLLFKRFPWIVSAIGMTLVAYLWLLAFGIFIDGRYLLPFALPIYFAEAYALGALVVGMRSWRGGRAAVSGVLENCACDSNPR